MQFVDDKGSDYSILSGFIMRTFKAIYRENFMVLCSLLFGTACLSGSKKFCVQKKWSRYPFGPPYFNSTGCSGRHSQMSRLVRDNQYHGKYHYVEELGHKSMWDSRDFSFAAKMVQIS